MKKSVNHCDIDIDFKKLSFKLVMAANMIHLLETQTLYDLSVCDLFMVANVNQLLEVQ